jgi:hypothetical protein
MIQIYINDKELDLPVDIINQIGINYEVFTIGEFANKFNSFSGNLTFPNTDTNRRVFGFATDNLNAGIVNREYTGRIVNNAVEVFSGEVNFERYNNGFECRFFTTGQVLMQKLQAIEMYDVLDALPATTDWFNHKFTIANFPSYGDGRFLFSRNVIYPNLDLGYFNRNDSKLGFWDYRPTFSLYTLLDAIAYKLGYTFNFNGSVPDSLERCFIAGKSFQYSQRLIDKNRTEISLASAPATLTNVELRGLGSPRVYGINTTPATTKTGAWTNNIYVDNIPARTNIFSAANLQFNTEFSFALAYYVRVTNLQYYSDFTGGQWVEYVLELDVKNGITEEFIVELLPDYNSGYSDDAIGGIAPTITQPTNTSVKIAIYANEAGYSPKGTTDAYATMIIRFKGVKRDVNSSVYFRLVSVSEGAKYGYIAGVSDQGLVNVTKDYYSVTGEPLVTLTHDDYIYPEGLIDAGDLLSNLKPIDVMKYAMRLSGTYLTETSNTFTLNRFDNYTTNTPTNWSGKANLLNGIAVDYLNNDLGESNWLVYKQDNANNISDPYLFGANLPSNVGNRLNILYESVFAQSVLSQTCSGKVIMLKVPYFNADIEKAYRVWQNAAVTYSVGQFVGWNGLLFKVIASVLGNEGTPDTLPAKYEPLTYSEFQPQNIEFRSLYIYRDAVVGRSSTTYYNIAGTLVGQNAIAAAFEPLSLQTAVDTLYAFIPSTFLDFRQIEVELMLTSIDIANLDLKKLVRIDELNGTFYVNALSNYTPDVSVPTKAILTLIP